MSACAPTHVACVATRLTLTAVQYAARAGADNTAVHTQDAAKENAEDAVTAAPGEPAADRASSTS